MARIHISLRYFTNELSYHFYHFISLYFLLSFCNRMFHISYGKSNLSIKFDNKRSVKMKVLDCLYYLHSICRLKKNSNCLTFSSPMNTLSWSPPTMSMSRGLNLYHFIRQIYISSWIRRCVLKKVKLNDEIISFRSINSCGNFDSFSMHATHEDQGLMLLHWC